MLKADGGRSPLIRVRKLWIETYGESKESMYLDNYEAEEAMRRNASHHPFADNLPEPKITDTMTTKIHLTKFAQQEKVGWKHCAFCSDGTHKSAGVCVTISA